MKLDNQPGAYVATAFPHHRRAAIVIEARLGGAAVCHPME